MSDLPPIVEQSLIQFEQEITELNRGGSKLDPKPHKLLMLLAVVDMADRGLIQGNRIYYDQVLRQAFENYFRLICGPSDWCQPGPPFFHLRSEPFWHHQVKEGREYAYSKLDTSGGGHKRIEENIEYAFLSDTAYRVISDSAARKKLRSFISELLNPYRTTTDV